MQDINFFLQKFKNRWRPKNLIWKRAIIEAVELETGLKVEPEKITLKENGVFLNLPPIIKSQIFIKRKKISARLEKTNPAISRRLF